MRNWFLAAPEPAMVVMKPKVSSTGTMQEIFRTGGPLLGDAANATDLSDLFDPGAVPKKP